MAKTNMICPFLGTNCQECAFYRGRHYYMCFAPKYRGHIAGDEENASSTDKANDKNYPWADFQGNFKMPARIPTNTYDPFLKPCNDIE